MLNEYTSTGAKFYAHQEAMNKLRNGQGQPTDSLEEWRLVPGTQNRWSVSSFGRTKRYNRIRQVKSIRVDGVIKAVPWIILELFVGPCPDGMECCHYDDNRENNALTNLRWDTREGNWRDRLRNNLHSCGDRRGVKNTMAKFTGAQVVLMRLLHKSAPAIWTTTTLAIKHNVSHSVISLILRRKSWRHLP